jgi:DNA-binding IclR family transcriptional regulator
MTHSVRFFDLSQLWISESPFWDMAGLHVRTPKSPSHDCYIGTAMARSAPQRNKRPFTRGVKRMGNVSHLVTRTAAFESSIENGLAEGSSSKDRQFVTALARGLDILRAFHAGEGMLGNQEIAHRTGLPKPTVARLTHTLTELGYLNYIRRFRKYELGASVLALGYAAISSMDVRRASRAPLEQLAHALNASTALGGRDRHSMIYLEACRGPSVVAITHEVGSRVPMASTAMGRAYLFSLPDVDRNKQLDAIRRRWRDDWTKVKTGLERSFKELADRGFCVTWGEWLPELCGVGAPLRNSDGTAAYAVNASAPIYQISRDRLEADWGPRLVKIARDIRTGMAAQPSMVSPQGPAVRPAMSNGNGHHMRPPMSAMARR